MRLRHGASLVFSTGPGRPYSHTYTTVKRVSELQWIAEIHEANLPAHIRVLSEILAEVKRAHLTREKKMSGILSYQKVEKKTLRASQG